MAQGSDLVMIAAVLQQSPLGLAWLDPEIESLEDMIGKRIGGSPDSPLNIDAAFAANDLPNDYEFVPIGFDPAPLANGEIDVIVCFVTNQPTVLELQGLEPISRTFSDFGTPLYADAIIGKRGYLDENREAVVGYLRAVIQGWEKKRRTLRSAPSWLSTSTAPTSASTSSSRPRRTSGRSSCRRAT